MHLLGLSEVIVQGFKCNSHRFVQSNISGSNIDRNLCVFTGLTERIVFFLYLFFCVWNVHCKKVFTILCAGSRLTVLMKTTVGENQRSLRSVTTRLVGSCGANLSLSWSLSSPHLCYSLPLMDSVTAVYLAIVPDQSHTQTLDYPLQITKVICSTKRKYK